MFNKECYCAQYNGPELSLSASGGVFFAFAKYIIEHGGCAFGAAFSTFPHLKHVCVESVDDLCKIQGSKYVESDFAQSLHELKKRVENGQLVLYSGTPCQIAAVRSFLKKNYENLLTIDILCHGTPSKAIFLEYIKWREKKWNDKICNYEFRNKSVSPWGSEQKALITTSRGKIVIPSECDPYFSAFQKGLIAKKKCYSCKYASLSREGDITAADFWSVKKTHPSFPYAKGASCLLVNTMTGKKFFEKIKENFLFEKASIDEICMCNPHFRKTLQFSPIQEKIYQLLDNNSDFANILPLIPYQSRVSYLRKKVIYCLKSVIKKILIHFNPSYR